MRRLGRCGILLLLVAGLPLSMAAVSGKERRQNSTPKPATANSLEQLSVSLQTVARQVEPAVVQIFNSAYGVEAEDDRGGGTVVAAQRTTGSGFLISSDGFIVTNAHVVQGARRLFVRLNKDASPQTIPLQSAKLVGLDQQTDLAVIKIDVAALPFLKFAESNTVEQGQIVLAFGSPLGLDNSVSMGVVSAVDRQIDPDSPFVFIQTDAAINPGNSGGPLVNTAGEVVGMNTFIFTQSGGNEGVGFAIPSKLVSSICHQIRVEHHVHHHQIGILVRAITPAMARGLDLPVQDGVVIEDVIPLSPADAAGLHVGDIILSVHGSPIPNVRQLAFHLYSYAAGEAAEIEVLRGEQKLTFNVPIIETNAGPQRIEDLLGPEDSPLPTVGILALTVDEKVSALLPPLRIAGGVVVVAKLADARPRSADELLAGDVIHALNGTPIADVGSLRSRLEALGTRTPLVMQVERAGSLHFVTIDDE